MDDMVEAGDLGRAFEDETSRLLADFTVAFVSVPPARADPELLGTGVFVRVEDVRAILTAQHVIRKLPDTGRLGMLLGPTNHVESVDTGSVQFLKIDKGKADSEGPDLGAVVLLAPSVVSSIGARKSFFNLTLHRDDALVRPPNPDDGVWAANGFLEERTMTWSDSSGRVKGFYNFTALGSAVALPKVGAYDYFDFPVDQKGRLGAPAKWGGMSGSGLWQVQIRREATALTPVRPLLCGIVFYQHPTTETSCGVRAHGRESVYRIGYDRIRESTLR